VFVCLCAGVHVCVCVDERVCVCVCLCVRARSIVCVCVCVRVCVRYQFNRSTIVARQSQQELCQGYTRSSIHSRSTHNSTCCRGYTVFFFERSNRCPASLRGDRPTTG
jgi:hypothetical protein